MSDDKEAARKLGLRSRRKGKRNEYLLRDSLRLEGYTAHRVPSSGAAQGAKGDVTYEKDAQKGRLELKARKDEYKMIYALYDTFKDADGVLAMAIGAEKLVLVSVHPSLDSVLNAGNVYSPVSSYEVKTGWIKAFKKTVQKLVNMEGLLGESNYLVIKTDRRPFLYINYR